MSSETRFAELLVTAPPPEAPVGGSEGAFTKVDGRECLLRCADLFTAREEVVQAIACFPPEAAADEADLLAAPDLKTRFGGHLTFGGVRLAPPVADWAGQIRSMAAKLDVAVTHAIVHDAARPAVAFSDLDALFDAVQAEPTHVHALAAPLPGEPLEVDGGGHPVGPRPAEAFRLLLWPRVFPKADLAGLGQGNPLPPARLRLVPGLPLNLRCNGPTDAKLLQAMLKLLPQPKREGPLNPFEEAQW